jgi:ubiquinone/menaquinone biosynthesis C-methylase UbiE
MSKQNPKELEKIIQMWNHHADTYDDYYKTFEGALEHYLDLELLMKYLPKNKSAKILDAAGGTGRITLPLVEMGYSVTLCDISPRMLDIARQKLHRQGMLDKLRILECDVCNLHIDEEFFDFTLCWGGGAKAVKELVRVTKKKGKISICIPNRCGIAISKFREDPEHALALFTSKSDYDYYEDEKYRVLSEEEIRELLEKEGIRVIEIYGYDIRESLSLSENVLEVREWDKEFFIQTAKMMLMLGREHSIKGTSRHFVIYGEKI